MKFFLLRFLVISFVFLIRRGLLMGMLDLCVCVYYFYNSWLMLLNFLLFDFFCVEEFLLEFYFDMIFCLFFSVFMICVLLYLNLFVNFLVFIFFVLDSWIILIFFFGVRYFLFVVGFFDNVEGILVLCDIVGNLVFLVSGFLVEFWLLRLFDFCLCLEYGK